MYAGADRNVAARNRCANRVSQGQIVPGVCDRVELLVVCIAVVGQMDIRVGVGSDGRADVGQFGALPLGRRDEAGAWADRNGIASIEHAERRTGLGVKGGRKRPVVA